MKLHHLAAAASHLLLALAATAVAVVTFTATNTASNTTGGQRFDQAVGVAYSTQVLSNASTFICSVVFNQTRPADRKPVAAISLVVADAGGAAAFTSDDTITLNALYVGNYSGGDVKAEVTGVLFHETTHVWQWDGQGQADGGLIEGVADYVRLKAGYAPGEGDRWDQGYDVTARFLDYCDSLEPGFVALLNAKMKDG
ncbi:hypothetical protein U9M48_009586 [Paspalum notatum var. saurae]|uniref:Uncharacterized protein n=1 Tax=Paspalum notatum var. saurae TaxID=547442 RepID=A0AAQ3SRT2_PASNO